MNLPQEAKDAAEERWLVAYERRHDGVFCHKGIPWYRCCMAGREDGEKCCDPIGKKNDGSLGDVGFRSHKR
jgi:hypothetical protein